jgi:hypothetical protein
MPSLYARRYVALDRAATAAQEAQAAVCEGGGGGRGNE